MRAEEPGPAGDGLLGDGVVVVPVFGFSPPATWPLSPAAPPSGVVSAALGAAVGLGAALGAVGLGAALGAVGLGAALGAEGAALVGDEVPEGDDDELVDPGADFGRSVVDSLFFSAGLSLLVSGFFGSAIPGFVAAVSRPRWGASMP